MPESLQFPGVYIQELSQPPAIQPASTSISAFVGCTPYGPDNTPVTVSSFSDFQNIFGPLTSDLELPFAVYNFFNNGGQQAVIVRTPLHYDDPNAQRQLVIDCGDPALGLLTFTARSSGDWANDQFTLTCDLTHVDPAAGATGFNLRIDCAVDSSFEYFASISLDPANPRFITTVLNDPMAGSRFFQVRDLLPATPPAPSDLFARQQITLAATPDGLSATTEILGDRTAQTGIYALLQNDDISLLCLPDATRPDPTNAACPDPSIDSTALYTAAVTLCEERGILLFVDPPITITDPQTAQAWIGALPPSSNAAAYFPRIIAADPTQTTTPQPTRAYAPCGFIAGVYARFDAAQGVWKASSGESATLTGALDLSYHLTTADTNSLNLLGLNPLQNLPPYGTVVWGARTLSSDMQWRYISVRRLALFLERSIQHGTAWAVFEPNTQATWDKLRLSIANFLQQLFLQGAFQGDKPADAYFVRCSLGDTMTQNDIDAGHLVVLVGFALLKSAEFTIIQITQLLGT